MWRFIVCSFAFLGWGFYELSGGSEFEPTQQASSIFAPVPEVTQEPTQTVAVQIEQAEKPQIVLASLTTRAEPLATLNSVDLVEPAKAQDITTPVVEEVVAAVEPEVETRMVKPNRVNVRGGPGTNHAVVAKLIKGDEVVILGDNSEGWFEIETIDGQIGWMADFLLVASN